MKISAFRRGTQFVVFRDMLTERPIYAATEEDAENSGAFPLILPDEPTLRGLYHTYDIEIMGNNFIDSSLVVAPLPEAALANIDKELSKAPHKPTPKDPPKTPNASEKDLTPLIVEFAQYAAHYKTAKKGSAQATKFGSLCNGMAKVLLFLYPDKKEMLTNILEGDTVQTYSEDLIAL